MRRNNLPRAKRQAGAKSSKSGQKKTPVPGTNTDTLRHVYELQAHQIELEVHSEEPQARVEIEAALRQYTNLYDFAPVGYFILRRDGTIYQANLSGGQLLGIKREELIEQCFRQFVSTEFYSVLDSFLETVFCGHRKEACEIKLLKNKREPIWVRIDATCSDASFQQGTCHLVVHDITEQKRAENILQVRFRITEFSAEHSLNELLQNALDELCALTDSPIGFFHFVESDQRTLSLQAWSTYTLKEMCTAEGRELHYDIDQAGVWADCVRQGRPIIHNDYASLPHRKGLPKGHAPVDREMVFPITRNQKIVAIIGIGNKSVDYTDSDLAYASRLADVVWDITEHKRAEEALRKSEERYKRMFEDSPISLWEEDFSQVKTYFDNLRASGVTDFRAYFENHPDAVTHCAGLVKVLDVNQATLTLLEGKDKEILLAGLSKVFADKEMKVFREEIITMAEGGRKFESDEEIHRTLTGQERLVTIHTSVAPGYENSLGKVLVSLVDVTERRCAEEALRKSEARYHSIVEDQTELICRYLPDGRLSFVNQAYARYYDETAQRLINTNFIPQIPEPDMSMVIDKISEITPQKPSVAYEHRIIKRDGEVRWQRWTHRGIYDADGNLIEHQAVGNDITERKRTEEIIEKRIVALTQPLECSSFTFEELFNLDEIQRAQDGFAQATGVASLITRPDGTPITSPSNFTRLCSQIIRKTEKGCANCYKSDAALGRYHPDGPIVQPCLSGGLWDAGASITVGGRHIANWLIGQVRDEAQAEEKMRIYAREIGADEAAFMRAFHKVPAMSRTQFDRIAQALFTLANQLSTSAYQNVQQARFITERNQAEEKLHRYLSELKVLYDNSLAISALQEPQEIGRKIIETLSRNLSWHHIVIRLRRGETNELEVIAFNQPNLDGQEAVEAEKRANTVISKVGQGLSGWSVQTGQTIRTGNVQEHPQYVDAFSGVHSGMYVPLTVNEQVIGCIAVESEAENAFTEEDERLLTTLAAQTAIAFENARLYQNIQQELQERERAEAALADEKAFTETALDSQRDIFFVFEPDSGRAIRWNRIFREMTGYTDEEIASLKVPDSYFSPEDLKKATSTLKSLTLGGNGRVELDLICKDGRRIPTECEVSFIPDKTRDINYMITIGRDITERKQAEQQIQFLAKFPAEDPNPVLRVAQDGILLYINEAGSRLLSQWNLQIDGAVPPILGEAVFQSMCNGATQTLDVEHGDHLYAFYVAPIVSAGYANLYGHDITQSRQVKALQDAEARYRVLFEQSPYGVLLAELKTGKIIEANEIASRQLGYTRDEFADMKISEYEASENPEQIARHMQKIVSEGRDDFETLHRTKSGEIRNVHVWVKTLRLNDHVLFYYILQDITERKRAEEELKNAHKQLERSLMFNEALLSAIPTPVFYKDKEGRYLGCNSAFAEFTGISSDQLKGKTVMELWPSENAEVYHQKDLEVMHNPERQMYEFKVQDENGINRPVIFVKDVFLDENKQVAGIVGAFLDITERKRMEEANEAYNREITLLEERQRIASDLHDAVSQTLFSARLASEMLLHQHDRQTDVFTRSLIDLHRLIRSASGEIRLILVELRSNALLNVSLETLLSNLLDSGMARTNANLIFQYLVEDLVLPTKIKLAFYRIAQEAISNAIKHGKPHNIQCTLRDEKQTLEMLIQDDGIGFSTDKVSDDHFGLQIMRERAEQAGLKLVITSQPGKGTSVVVCWEKE